MAGLLAGTRVLDLTNVLAGPFCCYQLAQLGAEVIKVEVPGAGDLARQLGADPELNRRGMGASFLAQNAGKRSITLNLKSAKGHAAFVRLVTTSDVVVENFRPGVMERLGLGYGALKVAKQRHRLLRDLRLRPGRAAQVQSRLRPDHPGPVRRDERHRRRAIGAVAGRISGCRHHGRHDRRLRHRRGAVPARAHGRGRVHRRLHAGILPGRHGLGGLELADRRREAAADGQREHDGEPVGHVPHRQGTVEHRGEQAGAVRDARPADRPRGFGDGPALRGARGAQAPAFRIESPRSNRRWRRARRRNGRCC